MTFFKKITVMAMLGAIGAIVGAMLGETLFPAGEAQRSEPRRICLLFDTSGSMSDRITSERGARITTQLEALKDAASDFVSRQHLGLDPMGLAVFASDAHVVTGVGDDAAALKRSIRNLTANGGTNLGRGFDVAGAMLRDEPGERWILVFTDGKPESSSTGETPEAAALSAAARVRSDGIEIVAIGTGLADAELLAEAAGSIDNVIISDPRKLQDAFRHSEEVINNRQMLASTGAGTGSFGQSVVQAGAWAALIAIGAAIGLVVGQNRHLRRRPLGPKEAAIILVGGMVTGLAAGAAGQSVFYLLSQVPAVEAIGRVVAWTLLGCGLGYGMGSFVPNLLRQRATAAGAAGGGLAAFCFLTLVPVVGDTVGRLLAAGILGLCTGMMMVLVETAYRSAWLVVHWSDKERSNLTLGSSPILVGSSAEAHVLLAEEDSPVPVMARISLGDGLVRFEDGQTGETRALPDGEMLTYGRIRLEVCAGSSEQRNEESGKKESERPAANSQRGAEVPESVKKARAKEGNWYDAA